MPLNITRSSPAASSGAGNPARRSNLNTRTGILALAPKLAAETAAVSVSSPLKLGG